MDKIAMRRSVYGCAGRDSNMVKGVVKSSRGSDMVAPRSTENERLRRLILSSRLTGMVLYTTFRCAHSRRPYASATLALALAVECRSPLRRLPTCRSLIKRAGRAHHEDPDPHACTRCPSLLDLHTS